MQFTAEEVYDECLEAILRCPQASVHLYSKDCYVCSDYELDRHNISTFGEMIRNNDVNGMALAFSNEEILTKYGYSEYLLKELWDFVRVSRAQYVIDSIIS